MSNTTKIDNSGAKLQSILAKDTSGEFNTAKTEIIDIKDGNISVGKSKDYDTTTGTIKTKFDTKEDIINKENDILDTSIIKYPTNRLVKEYADTKQPIKGEDENYVTDDEKIKIENIKNPTNFVIAPSNAVNKNGADLVLTGVDDVQNINLAINELHTTRGNSTTSIKIDFLGGDIFINDEISLLLPYDNFIINGNGCKITSNSDSLMEIIKIEGNNVVFNSFIIKNNTSLPYPNLKNYGNNCFIQGLFYGYSIRNYGNNCTIDIVGTGSGQGVRNSGSFCNIKAVCTNYIIGISNTESANYCNLDITYSNDNTVFEDNETAVLNSGSNCNIKLICKNSYIGIDNDSSNNYIVVNCENCDFGIRNSEKNNTFIGQTYNCDIGIENDAYLWIPPDTLVQKANYVNIFLNIINDDWTDKIGVKSLGNNCTISGISQQDQISGDNIIVLLNGEILSNNISGENTGDETQATIKTKLGASSESADGYLTKEDFSNFNSKIATSISHTYEELKALKEANELIAGQTYILTDYQNKYKQPQTNTIKTISTTESLVLTAKSNNQFDIVAQSIEFPNDIIHYDFIDYEITLGLAGTGVNGTSDRKGFIIYRYDTINEISTHYDFRNLLWDRNGVDFVSFSSNSFSIKVGKNSFDIVAKYTQINTNADIAWIEIGDNCYFITLGDSCNFITLGDSCNFITLGYGCYSITLGYGCYSITLGYSCSTITLPNGSQTATLPNNTTYLYDLNGQDLVTKGTVTASNLYTKSEIEAITGTTLLTNLTTTIKTSLVNAINWLHGIVGDITTLTTTNKTSTVSAINELQSSKQPSGNYEVITNKVTSISSTSTDIQYPSAKAVYDNLPQIIEFDGQRFVPTQFWNQDENGFYLDDDGSWVMTIDENGDLVWKDLSEIPQVLTDDITGTKYTLKVDNGVLGINPL